MSRKDGRSSPMAAERSHDPASAPETSLMTGKKHTRRLTAFLPVWSWMCDDVIPGAAAALLGPGGDDANSHGGKDTVSLMLLFLSLQMNPPWSQPLVRLPANGDAK